MEASELRINNWLENFLGEPFQVNHETIRMLSIGGAGKEYPEPKPIPLTEEWLLKLGVLTTMKHGEPKEEKKVYKYTDHNYKDHWYYLIEFTGDDGYGGRSYSETKVEYVHTLQNLHFALTGEELRIDGND